MTRDFDGNVVVVTGASTGLGRAIAVEVASRGAAAVIVNYAHHAAEAEESAALVRARGAEAVVVQGDVADDDGCKGIAAAAQRLGRIDALFNNAGMSKLASNHADLNAVSSEDFLRLYQVNVVGTFQMIRATKTLLEAAHAPAVVNTSSLAGVTGIGSSVPYTASKGALITMTIDLARALAPRIRVNAVCPGYMDTPWWQTHGADDAAQERLRNAVVASTPLQAASSAEDVAGAAVFLASPAARHITGEILLVDAGLHLGFAPLIAR